MYRDGALLAALEDIGRDQFQLVTRPQALTLLSRNQIDRLRGAGLLRSVYPGVYALPGSRPTWRQRAMGACLTFGRPVALAGLSAAHLWELDPGGHAISLEVVVPRNRNGRRQGVVAHRVDLLDGDLAERFGLPVTSPVRTILDLSRRLSREQLERYLDRALRDRRLTMADLRWRVERQVGQRCRYHPLRSLLDERGVDYRAGDSHAEDELYLWIVRAGLPGPDRQVQVVVRGRVYLLDLAYVQQKIAIEYDSFRYHGGVESFYADRQRTLELQLAGWMVLQVTARHDEDSVVKWIRRALNARSPE